MKLVVVEYFNNKQYNCIQKSVENSYRIVHVVMTTNNFPHLVNCFNTLSMD